MIHWIYQIPKSSPRKCSTRNTCSRKTTDYYFSLPRSPRSSMVSTSLFGHRSFECGRQYFFKILISLVFSQAFGSDLDQMDTGKARFCPPKWRVLYCHFFRLNKFPSRAKKIDVLSRIIFPAIFACFNLSYWCYYLMQEAHSDQ